ncbi:helix-turn-helix domain-containing protein [Maridesulfovibrio sp. FT414]|uniref:helix-turn-helix domain-containing protein n=1 Tax=Maridesulfovibrio sp. FT414 TaxID=2979469 RepID=UPI003D805172
MSDIVERFLSVREFLGLKKADFCRDVGISTTSYDNYSNGKGAPKAVFLANICKKFGVSGTWLLTGQGDFLRKSQDSFKDCLPQLTKKLMDVETSMDKAARLAKLEAMKAVIEGEIEAEKNMQPGEAEHAANG